MRSGFRAVLYPDLKHRTVLGWQIRWVAGLSCLLMVAAGSIPAYATEFDREFDSKCGVLAEATANERVNLPETCPASVECLLSGATTWQPEVETEQADASPSLSAFQLSCFRDVRCAVWNDERFLRSTDASGHRFSRAPPLA